MILCNLAIECEHIIGIQQLNSIAPPLIEDILQNFYDKENGLIRENISGIIPPGTEANNNTEDNSGTQQQHQFVDTFEGRLLNPGHSIEAMWFLMDLSQRFEGSEATVIKAKDILLRTLQYGWDKQYGGIFYFLDVKGKPPQQLEWDQ